MKTQKSLKNHARQKHGNCKNTEKHGKPSRFLDYLYCHSVTSHDAANAAHLLESQGSWRPTWTVGRLPSSNRIRSKSDKTKFICLSGRDQLAKIYVKFLGIRFLSLGSELNWIKCSHSFVPVSLGQAFITAPCPSLARPPPRFRLS